MLIKSEERKLRKRLFNTHNRHFVTFAKPNLFPVCLSLSVPDFWGLSGYLLPHTHPPKQTSLGFCKIPKNSLEKGTPYTTEKKLRQKKRICFTLLFYKEPFSAICKSDCGLRSILWGSPPWIITPLYGPAMMRCRLDKTCYYSPLYRTTCA